MSTTTTKNPLETDRLTISPRSSSVLSSTLAAMTSQRQSTSARYPLYMGVAALKANRIGVIGVNWSYNQRASLTLTVWKVTCRQQQPIPNPMASLKTKMFLVNEWKDKTSVLYTCICGLASRVSGKLQWDHKRDFQQMAAVFFRPCRWAPECWLSLRDALLCFSWGSEILGEPSRWPHRERKGTELHPCPGSVWLLDQCNPDNPVEGNSPY